MKKFLLRIALTLGILILQINSALAFYADVPENHKYYEAIKTLYEFGRVPILEDNLFKPDETLTRKEFYKFLLTYGMANLSKTINLPYTDISNDSSYAVYIQTAIDLKILKPTGENPLFYPDKKISKEEIIKVTFNTLGIGINYFFTKENFPFTDISADSTFAPIAQKAADLKILETNNPKKFKKNKRLTKAEFINYLYKIHKSTTKPVLIISKIDTNELTGNPSYSTFLDVWKSLQENYYYKDKLNDQQLLLNAIKALVDEAAKEGSDKYTVFEKPNTTSSIVNKLQNEYEGIGIIIELVNNNITIVSPFKGSPAEEAGLKAKDIITKIDGQSIIGETLENVSIKIKGPKESEVKITVQRDGQELEIPVIRKFINLDSVDGKIMSTPSGKSIGYISIINFGAKTYEEFTNKAKELINTPLSGLIIDLRNNPGGYLDVAVNIIGLFSKEIKTAVSLEFSDKHSEKYKTNGNGLLSDYKIVVLINEGSASAAEILAGTLQDYKIATLIGQKSFGKGSVQELRQYKDGSILKYTVSNWLTPNGKIINGQGITPDKIIHNVNDQDLQLESALGELN